ncbi:hypothetical protein DICVIV_07268 [Dictyocaulus viviparus]|uniref:Uncharacterized protein n=1 Tax=Dictyocaulus viviparus TaxID=29172 RepID=A0A0D8XQ35_DICVI|nr:hypothetical protein DICVIV_07268 [Dictyocaulus viviparus]
MISPLWDNVRNHLKRSKVGKHVLGSTITMIGPLERVDLSYVNDLPPGGHGWYPSLTERRRNIALGRLDQKKNLSWNYSLGARFSQEKHLFFSDDEQL